MTADVILLVVSYVLPSTLRRDVRVERSCPTVSVA